MSKPSDRPTLLNYMVHHS